MNQNALPTAGIAIAPVDGNNIINLARAQSGFAISGSEAGADGQIVTVTIFDGSGKLVGSYTTVAAGGSWSVTVPPAYAATLADGIYTIKATVLDPLGNPPAIATQTIAVDQTPPVLTVAAINGDNLLNRAGAQAGFAISGTEVGADGQPVTVFILDHSGNVVATYTTLAGTGGWSVNVSAAYATALADGAYTVEAVVSDAAGNPSAPATEVIAVHETGPNVAIAAITGDNIVNRSEAQAGFVISGSETGADAQAVTITILDSSGHAVDKYTTTAAGGAWSVQVTPAEAIALADGSYRVTAATSDTFGNQGITTQTLTVDQTPPTVTIAAITGDNVVNLSEAQTGFVIAGTETGADGQTITVQIVDHANRVVETYTTTGAGGTWSVNVSSADATALADGTYTVTASVSDPAGNPAATTQTFTVDETPPTITVAPITGDNVINLSEAQAGFAIGGSEIGADGQTVTITILDGTGHAVDKYTTTAAGGAWSVSVSSADATALLDGTYAVTATVSDAAGNPASARQTITVDETPPTITIAAVTGDNVINLSEAQAGFTLNGNETGADGQVVTIAILNGEGRVIDSYTATAAGGAWSVNVSTADATALADGSYKAVAGVSDAAGNSATASQPFSVDETPPTIGIAAITGDNVINLSEAQAGFAIGGGETGADGQAVTVTILGNAGHVINIYTTVATGGTWSVNVSSADATALADGTYTVTASVSDAAANPASATQTLKVDETPPTNWDGADHRR